MFLKYRNQKEEKKKSRLIRKEWNGKWSDDSAETKKNKELIENELNKKYKVMPNLLK